MIPAIRPCARRHGPQVQRRRLPALVRRRPREWLDARGEVRVGQDDDDGAKHLGQPALGFRHRDDLHEIRALLDALGVAVNVVAPQGASPADLARLQFLD